MRHHHIIHLAHRLGQLKSGVERNSRYLLPYLTKYGKSNLFPRIGNRDIYQNLQEIYRFNRGLSGPRINIGGDHSVAIATVADSLQRYPDLRVVWFDAHPDINTYQRSTSKNYHGMPLSLLTGLDSHPKLNFIRKTLDFSNLLYVGIREIDPFEREIIDKYQIQTISCDTLNYRFPIAWETIGTFVQHQDVHLSFDVDCLDPSQMPSTGTPSQNGLVLPGVKRILDQLHTLHHHGQTNLQSLDITELNLQIGTELERHQSLTNLLYLFSRYFRDTHSSCQKS